MRWSDCQRTQSWNPEVCKPNIHISTGLIYLPGLTSFMMKLFSIFKKFKRKPSTTHTDIRNLFQQRNKSKWWEKMPGRLAIFGNNHMPECKSISPCISFGPGWWKTRHCFVYTKSYERSYVDLFVWLLCKWAFKRKNSH